MSEGEETQADLMTFLVSAVHDMKNSVSVMSAHIENLLAEHDVETLPGYEQTARMLYEVKRVNNNLVQLLAMYKLGQQHYPFDSQEHSIAEFIEEVVLQNQALFDSLKLTISTEYDPAQTWYFDEDLVNGVISHAINNAAHYTKSEIRLIVRKVDGFLEMRVEDDGRGYPPSMLEQGATLARGVSFASGSTGLGLYFSAMVAQLHKNRGRVGSMALENGGSLNGGCFILRLP